MTLNEEIVQQIDLSRENLQKVYDDLQVDNYNVHYHTIWTIRAEMEFVVATLKLLNNFDDQALGEKWKTEFGEKLKQVRSERTIRQAFLETLALFNELETIEDIIDFYKICWKIKEKLTVLLNVVKPKHKLPEKATTPAKPERKRKALKQSLILQ
ncbi:MAG: hypothetical protein ACTSV6_00385 [Candidatus Heimdallarchaeota archaeon]